MLIKQGTMMKAQSFFGGTNPKDHAVKVRQVGHTGSVQNKTGKLTPKVTNKQVGSKGRNS